jgi:mannosylglycoprotein endo-beta-mannosidase
VKLDPGAHVFYAFGFALKSGCDNFESVMEDPPPRTRDFYWPNLQLSSCDLSAFDRPFSEDEVWQAIRQMPVSKAPGPDGFTGLFFRKCWQVIRPDVMAAIHAFYDLRCRDLNLLNKVAIVLLPKKEGAEDVRDFRPISLIHAVAKIITKVLALRLEPLLSQLISTTQSAFIKKRSIHDNFLYVRNLTRRFHRTKTPALLLKLDISKAFDSVRWDYLLSLMQHRGFPTRWQNWITALLSSSTSTVMLNGSPLLPIQHGRGLRQGDPLSPLLFILAIEPLNQLLQVATDRGLLTKLNGRAARFRISMYTDDVVVFLKPSVTDATNLRDLLLNFGKVTGLQTNLQKTTVSTISCDNIDLEVILAALPIARAHFPLKYLELPLSPYRLRKLDFQPQIEKAVGKLSVWNGKNLTQAGRVSLTKSVLSSQPVYLLSVIKPPKEVLDDIDKLRRRFLWRVIRPFREESVRSTGRKRHFQKNSAISASLTSTGSLLHSNCGGSGMSGPHRIKRGWARRCLVPSRTDCFLRLAPQSL